MNPIFSVTENVLTSLKGLRSVFYEVLPPDMEGLDLNSQERVFLSLESDLINTDKPFKLYWLNKKLYLNSFGKMSFSHGELIPQGEPIKTFIGRDDIDVNFYENYLTQSSDFVRLISVRDFPHNFERLRTFDWPDFVLSFKKIDKLPAKNKINLKRKLHFSSQFKSLRDIESENAFHQSETLLEDITTDQKALFKIEMFIIVRGATKEELDRKTLEVEYQFKGQGASVFVEERGLSFFYQSLFPGVEPSFKRAFDMPSDCLSYLIPYHRDFIMEEGFELTSRRGSPLYFDLWNSEALNYNVLITGASGQGKSMMANKLLWQELGRGTKAMVLDLGNSFAKNAKFHEGSILSLSFNPYQFRNARYLKEFVLAAIDEKLSKKDEGRLFEEITKILDNSDVTNFADFLSELEKSFTGIRYYFNEIEEYFTDETYSLNDFTYCDFGNYPDAMKAPLIIYLIEYFKNLEGKKIFIFDECWHLLLKNADYIAECFRTFRKHMASAVAISQNLDDFSESQLGRVIIQNTYYKFLFRQDLTVSEFLDSHAKAILDSVQSMKGVFSEFLLLTERIKKPVRFYPEPLEYQVMTSAREDNVLFEEYLKMGGSLLPYSKAIKNFTQLLNPLAVIP